MSRSETILVAAAALFMAGCAPWRLWGEIDTKAPPAMIKVPEAPAERRKAALFYSDLGPDVVDVSAYPAERRRDYEVYARVCSSCHTLARSISAPYVSRNWWGFYVDSMRVRAKIHAKPLTKAEARAVLDFLEHDSIARKLERPAEFEAITAELRRRFDAELDERMELLQKRSIP